MPLAGIEGLTGTEIAVVAGEPTAYTKIAFEALSYQTIIGVVTMGEWGNQEEDINEPLLKDSQVIHQNGPSDGGEVPISVQYRATDPGSAILLANGGSNTVVTIRKKYVSGATEYGVGILTSPRYREASGSAIRGYTITARINTPIFPFAGP